MSVSKLVSPHIKSSPCRVRASRTRGNVSPHIRAPVQVRASRTRGNVCQSVSLCIKELQCRCGRRGRVGISISQSLSPHIKSSPV